MRHALNVATALSANFLAIAVTLFLAGYHFNAWDYQLSVSHNFHIGLWSRGLDSRIAFFNDAEYGPYRGSIIGLVDEDGSVYPPIKRERLFGDFCGIYYRYFEWFDQPTLWTLMVSLWYPIIGFALLPTIRMCSCLRRQIAFSPNKSLHPTAATPTVMESQSGGG